ncbi:hypothetical protein L1887_48019 [Cichorium endivia]|nr:hypothetical protein L1887_48019 [Cichorium endivia]
MLKQYEDKQAALKAQEEAERQRQSDLAAKQQRDFEEQQRQQAEQQRLAQEQLMRAQMDQMQGGRLAELEREVLAMRGQYERDQLMLEQYDRRVKALETELANIGQNFGRSDAGQGRPHQAAPGSGHSLAQTSTRLLAKLYSQLRTEHLDMLGKYKQMQIKAGSAQEAVDKMERMERDVKAKNLELADMIRERDRARFDLDRIKASQKEEFDRLKRDLMFANERAEDATRAKSSELSGMMSTLNRQIAELEDSLREKRMELDARDAELARIRDEKDAELAIMQEGMDATIKQLTDMQLNQGESDQAVNAQIDTLILDNSKKLNAIIDSILQACVDKVDDALYELESPSASGNTTATPEYVLSMIEKGTHLHQRVCHRLLALTSPARWAASTLRSSNAPTSSPRPSATRSPAPRASQDWRRTTMPPTSSSHRSRDGQTCCCDSSATCSRTVWPASHPAQRRDVVARQNLEARAAFGNLNSVVETMVKAGNTMLANANGDIGDIVEREMMNAASAIDAATAKLQALLSRPRDHNKYSAVDLQVHDAILEASLAITHARSPA